MDFILGGFDFSTNLQFLLFFTRPLGISLRVQITFVAVTLVLCLCKIQLDFNRNRSEIYLDIIIAS